MIRPLRTRHRLWVTALAVALPLLFAAGLLARKPPAVMERLPAELQPQTDAFPVVLEEYADLWSTVDIHTRLLGDRQPPTRLAIALSSTAMANAPDALVYWTIDPAPTGETPLDGAYLIGSLFGNSSPYLALPDTALHVDGHLILYSLAHQETLATASLPTQQP